MKNLGAPKQLVICTGNTGNQFLYRHDQELDYKSISKITKKLVNKELRMSVAG